MRSIGASPMAVASQIQKLVDERARADCADARPFVVSRSSAPTSSFFSLASSFLLATWARLVRFKASCPLQRWQNSQALPLWQPSALKEKKRQGVHLPSACILSIANRGIGTALGEWYTKSFRTHLETLSFSSHGRATFGISFGQTKR